MTGSKKSSQTKKIIHWTKVFFNNKKKKIRKIGKNVKKFQKLLCAK